MLTKVTGVGPDPTGLMFLYQEEIQTLEETGGARTQRGAA